MGWFSRWFDWRPAPSWKPDFTAIPLSPAEVITLAQALSEHRRKQQIHRPDVYGSERAGALMNRAGVASAYGHDTVPVLLYELADYGRVLDDLRQWAPHDRLTSRFERLLLRMHALAGVARVKGWTAVHDATGIHWPIGAVPVGTDLPQLGAGEGAAQ